MELALSILLLISMITFAIYNIIEIVCSIKFYKRLQREYEELADYLVRNSRKGDN
jgi:hypothetical protein